MKRFVGLFLAALMVVSVLAVSAFAADTSNAEDSGIMPLASQSYTLSDGNGNTILILGSATRVGTSTTVSTRYQITHYQGGGAPINQNEVDGSLKTSTATGYATFSGGGSDNFGGTQNFTGEENTLSYTKNDYSYYVTLITGTHIFQCTKLGFYRNWSTCV